MSAKFTALLNKLSKPLPWLHIGGTYFIFVLVYLFAAVHSPLGQEISAGESPGFAFLAEYLLVFMSLALGYLIVVGALQHSWIRSDVTANTGALKLSACIQFVCIAITALAIWKGRSHFASGTAFVLLASILLQAYIVLWHQQVRSRKTSHRIRSTETHAFLFLALLFVINAIVTRLDPAGYRLREFMHFNSNAEIALQKFIPAVFSGITGLWFGILTLAILSLSGFLLNKLSAKTYLNGFSFFLPFVLLCGFYSIMALTALMVAIEWQVDQLGLRPAAIALAFLLTATGGALVSKIYLQISHFLPPGHQRSTVALVCVSMGALFVYPLFWLVTTRPYRRVIWIMLILSIVLLCGLVSYVLLSGDLFNPWFTSFSYLKSILLKLSAIITAGALVLLFENVFLPEKRLSSGYRARRSLLAIVFIAGFVPFGLLNHYPNAKTILLQYSDLTRVDAAYARELAGILKFDRWVRLGQNPTFNQQPHPWPQPWKLRKVKSSQLPKGFNLMVIVVDALRGDAFHSAGYNRNLTPFLDKWAIEETVSFRRAYSQGGGSFAAFPFLVAGRSRFRLYGPDLYQENLFLKIAEAEGIQHYMVMKGFGPRSIFPPDYAVTELIIPRALSDRRTATAEEVFDSARRAIARIKAGERFLCFLHLMDVHNDRWKKTGGTDYGDAPRDLYDNNLSYLDRAFEQFINWLKLNYIYDKTVILFTADHGEQFWEHGASLHGHTVYEEEIRIPAILLTHHMQRRFDDMPVIAADMAPTIAELAGYAIDPPYDDPHMGISLVPLLTGDDRTRYLQRDIVGRASFKRRYFLYRNWQWKFIYLAELDLVQLFDIAEDPMEKNNLVEAKPRLAADLEQALLRYLDRVEGKTYRPLLSRFASATQNVGSGDN
ncbi:MAG: sulfatase-like hydrolase/transferase [Desulfobacterales bacterium]|jgi:glucan phosphoethanolaminetransferase (alkaline phosphatase superfamily)